MGIRFFCPNGHKLHVKSFLAGKKGICPECGARMRIPTPATETSNARTEGAYGTNEEYGDLDFDSLSPAIASSRPQPIGDASKNWWDDGGPIDISDPASGSVAVSHVDEGLSAFPDVSAKVGAIGPDSQLGVLDEAPELVWYVRLKAGDQFGPANGPTMNEWLGQGRVPGDSLVWREGWAEWRRANEVFPDRFGAVKVSKPIPEIATLGKTIDPLASRKPKPKQNKSANWMAIALLAVCLGISVCIGLSLFYGGGNPTPGDRSDVADTQ